MKKLVLFILLCGVAYAATFSELERRVSDLEQQVAKLTIKLLDKEMAKESPILKATIDTTNYVTGLPSDSTYESDEDYGEDEDDDDYIIVDDETYNNMLKKCIDFCTDQFNKSWNQSVDEAHQCMDDCMRF